MGLRSSASKTLDDVIANDDRDYVRLDLGMEWAIRERLFLNGGYGFTTQQFTQKSMTHRRTSYFLASFGVDARTSTKGTA